MTSPVTIGNQSGSGEVPRDSSHPYYVYTERRLADIPQLACLPEHHRFGMRTIANVLPFRVNRYVIEELIDWNRVPDDPIFQLTFPQPGMLAHGQFDFFHHQHHQLQTSFTQQLVWVYAYFFSVDS
jgi:L-lysine 2,3-aminomutase